MKNKNLIAGFVACGLALLAGLPALAAESPVYSLSPSLESGLSGTVNNCAVLAVANGAVAAYPGCAISCNAGFNLVGSACVAPVCSVATVANGVVGVYPGCAITCNSGFNLANGACVVQANPTCAIATVANGEVAAYPGCAITCNSGYNLVDNACVANVVQSGGGGGGGGGSSFAPTSIDAINVPMVLTATQTGTATNIFPQGEVKLVVPAGSISGQTTFSVTMASGTSGEVPDNTTGAFMIGNKVVNINASDTGGAQVHNFSANLNISVTMPDLPADTSDLAVYYYDTVSGTWILVPGAVFDPVTKKVTFQVNHLTKFAVLKAGRRLSVPLRAVLPVTVPVVKSIVKSIAITPVATPVAVVTSTTGQVLGVKTYADGTLLRVKTTKKVYLVSKGRAVLVASVKDLAKYKGKKIFDVDQGVVDNMNKPAVVAVTTAKYADGTVLRSQTTKKLYVIFQAKKFLISTITYSKKYAGKPIIVVGESVLKNY